MSSIAPAGTGLVMRDSSHRPPQMAEEERKRGHHYVISPSIDLDITNQTWKRLSHTVFPRARICLLETFWYPIKNRSQAKFDNPQTEPGIVPFEKTAFSQTDEFITSYGIYGGARLNSITGCDVQLVNAFEKLLMPSADRPDTYALPNLVSWLQNEAREGIEAIADEPHFQLIAEKLRMELLGIFLKARNDCEYWLNKSEIEIESARAGKSAKSALDPLDFKLYSALGLEPRSDLARRVGKTRQKDEASFPVELVELLKSNNKVDVLLARIEELERRRVEEPKAVAAPVKVREMKLCKFCASEVFAEAIYCIHCEHDLPADKPATPKPAVTAAQKAVDSDKEKAK